ncbi:MAG: GNAT family N-acetyltransferase [Cetobacterium sp.]
MFKVKDYKIDDLKTLANINENAFRKDSEKQSFEEFRELTKDFVGKVIVLESEIIGAIFFRKKEIEGEIKIERLFISPKYQNKGLGYFIIARLKEENPSYKIELEIHNGNFKTKKFCEKIKREI